MTVKGISKITVLIGLVVLLSLGYVLSQNVKLSKGAKPLKIIDLKIGVGEKETVQFSLKDQIRLTYDVRDIFAMKVRGVSYIWLRQDIMIRDEKGAVVLIQPGVLEIKKPVSEKPARFINEITLSTIENIKPGNYKIYVFVMDVISFQTDMKVLPFSIK